MMYIHKVFSNNAPQLFALIYFVYCKNCHKYGETGKHLLILELILSSCLPRAACFSNVLLLLLQRCSKRN